MLSAEIGSKVAGMRVAILANDVPPGFGVPVAAPGIRCWGLAEGLQRHGIEAWVMVPWHVLRRFFGEWAAIAAPRNCLVLHAEDVGEVLEAQRFDYIVLTNFNEFSHIHVPESTGVVYDMFAPKLLECLVSRGGEGGGRGEMQRLWERKASALRRASVLVVNGAKKINYARRLASLAGASGKMKEVVVPMCLSIPGQGGLDEIVEWGIMEGGGGSGKIMMGGYLQEWAIPGAWALSVAEYAREGGWELEVVAPEHWGGSNVGEPEALRYLKTFEHVCVSGSEPLESYLRRLGESRVFVDLFEESLERRYAMVTRTITALAAGVPVIHPPFTEVAPLVEKYDAGWLVKVEEEEYLAAIFRQELSDETVVRGKKENALLLGKEVLDPERATADLAKELWER